ncbi:hypothetical protein [Chromobacterium haemolyticum]|uniref:hypothetical protein n=1 Tax=Chromobacterium haemolyticum TaxID=394935 RepID=UPI0009D9D52B|nr:hypothetical protein [Chromobacterium haemolyticum]OQS40533.1 hypothetical protein B0T39_10940 [Chromobacterium haemolyticum]
MDHFKGDTWRRHVRLESGQLSARPVAAIDSSGAAVRLSVPAHGLPPAWRAAVTGVALPGLTARNRPPVVDDFHQVMAIDANTLEVINVSGAGWPHYTGGAVLQFGAPLDLAGVSARATFRPPGGPPLLVLSQAPALVVDPGGVWITAPPEETVRWPSGPIVCALALTWPDGAVQTIIAGRFTVKEPGDG